ncbi:MAG TPA: ABC transporter permease [Polyangiaceae bacterium]|nr:ABC transporter permease [Polyangiaceae bacterium]
MMSIPLNYGLRALLLRKGTTFATAIGIALVVFVLASTFMLADGLSMTLLAAGSPQRAIVLGEDAFDESTSRIKQEVATLVSASRWIGASSAEAPLASAESVVHVYLANSTGNDLASVQLRGVPANVFEVRPEATVIEGRAIRVGTAEALVGKGLLGRYAGLTLGGKVELQKGKSVTIVGVLAAGGSAYESEVWLDLDTLRSAFGSLGYLSAVSVSLGSSADFEQFEAEVESDPRRGLKVERERVYYERISSRLGAIISVLGGTVVSIFAVAALLGAMITMYGSVDRRSREIGTLRAIGFSQAQILLLLLIEAGALALAGGALGAGLALLTPWLDFSTINYATGQEVAFRFLPSVETMGLSLLAGLAMGILGGLLPALKAATGNPIDALRPSG